MGTLSIGVNDVILILLTFNTTVYNAFIQKREKIQI